VPTFRGGGNLSFSDLINALFSRDLTLEIPFMCSNPSLGYGVVFSPSVQAQYLPNFRNLSQAKHIACHLACVALTKRREERAD